MRRFFSMRRSLRGVRVLTFAALSALMLTGWAEIAQAQFFQARPSTTPAPTPGVNRITANPRPAAPPGFVRGMSATTVTRVPRAGTAPDNQGPIYHGHHGHHHGHSRPWYPGYPAFGWGGWGPNYPTLWTGGYIPPFATYYYPQYVPYTAFFPVQPSGFVPEPAVVADPAPANVDPQPPKSKIKVTNAEQKAKAGRALGFGDGRFAKQEYLAALERYKSAAEMAPDLAEPYMRQAHALVALGQYESAAKAFRRGLRIRADWSGSPFRLEQLYLDDPLVKTTQFEALAKQVEANPFDATILMVLGLQLYFDGQHERAEMCIARAAQLGANEDRLLDRFLPQPKPSGAADLKQGDNKPSESRPGAKVVF